MAKVSIVIPVWGSYLKYLDECLADLKKQTYKDFEIVVSDKATDLPTARNKGIAMATGEYIVPLDVDDKLEPTFIEKCLEKSGENIGIIRTGLRTFGEYEVILKPSEHIELSDFLVNNQVFVCSMFPKAVWQAVGGYDEQMKQGYEDWEFWLRIVKNGYKIATLDEPLFLYRVHEGSMMSTVNDQELREYIKHKHAGSLNHRV